MIWMVVLAGTISGQSPYLPRTHWWVWSYLPSDQKGVQELVLEGAELEKSRAGLPAQLLLFQRVLHRPSIRPLRAEIVLGILCQSTLQNML